MKKCWMRELGCLLLVLGWCAAMLPAQGDGREMRRNIFRLGYNLGVSNALMEKRGDDPNFRRMMPYGGVADWLRLVIADYQPPYDPAGLSNILQRLENYEAQTAGKSGGQIAAYFEGLKGSIHQSLALTYGLETPGRFTAEPTCDSAILDLGYHLGRLSVYADPGSAQRSGALSGIHQAVATGSHCAEHLLCAFVSAEDWNSLNVQAAATVQEVDQIRARLEEMLFGLTSAASAPVGIPSSPPGPPADLTGKWGQWGYGTIVITREGSQYVARDYGTYLPSPNRRCPQPKGFVWFHCSVEPQRVPGLPMPVFVGKRFWCDNSNAVTYVDVYIETGVSDKGRFFQFCAVDAGGIRRSYRHFRVE